MDEIKKQAPENFSEKELNEIFNKNNNNVIDTLTELWNIKPEKKNSNIIQEKWREIRDLCNDHDNEMYNQLKKQKK